MKSYPTVYSLKDWQESTVFELANGYKVTRVDAAFTYSGVMSGESKVAYIMRYDPDQTGVYDGWEEFQGTFDGVPSTLLLRHEGDFEAKGVDAIVTNVPLSGTGGLEGKSLSFDVRFEGHGPYEFVLKVD